MENKKYTVIFDLDGTLALNEHRQHFLKSPYDSKTVLPEDIKAKFENWKPDWNAFYEACDKDKPNLPVIEMCNVLYDAGYQIVILSGRSYSVFRKTTDWLIKHEVKYHHLQMRDIEDYTPDEILKLKWYSKSVIKDKVLCVFDDRQKVVDMWRNEGLTCFQVASGKF